MALEVINLGRVSLGNNETTKEMGFLTQMIAGQDLVKGEVVSNSTTTDFQIIKQTNEFDAIGIVADDCLAGDYCLVWKNGSRCKVLFKDGVASTRGYVAICGDTDGRAIDIEVPSSNPTQAQHFKEIGHVCESVEVGTDILVLVDLHFN